MRCSISSCKYYLHLSCFRLSTQLSSLPLLHTNENENDHSLVLQSGDKLKPWKSSYCRVCHQHTNGLFYGCTECDKFKVDIKCASMPDTIYHAAHPNHLLDLRSAQDTNMRHGFFNCDACGGFINVGNSYECSSCDFGVHFRCAVLPASTTSRRWDKHHPLLLTHNATLNRPGDFYCNQCEQEMHPKHWMYHCRSCDHPRCLPTTSGCHRNIKLGQECHVNAETHPHPLTFQLLTTKRRCDVCGGDRHDSLGFYCASCIFFICLYDCGKKMIEDGNIEAVD
ncbi:zinc finger protein 607-like [Salvia hispanica]|uniref:zinc finger protein 607-like n=1 Tax=Salvia hispanica TaxID=49212 RepID=UPI0020097553|nr:zinc finger protein 607-like [Salvia hispanica]